MTIERTAFLVTWEELVHFHSDRSFTSTTTWYPCTSRPGHSFVFLESSCLPLWPIIKNNKQQNLKHNPTVKVVMYKKGQHNQHKDILFQYGSAPQAMNSRIFVFFTSYLIKWLLHSPCNLTDSFTPFWSLKASSLMGSLCFHPFQAGKLLSSHPTTPASLNGDDPPNPMYKILVVLIEIKWKNWG